MRLTLWFMGLGPLWRVAVVLILAFVLYFSVFAARRYVSEAHVVVDAVQGPLPSAPDFAAMLGGPIAPRDLLLLRDHLQSADMLAKLDARLDLRTHYSDSYDPFSRLIYMDAPFEWLQMHYKRRVSAEYDDTAGVLVIRAQAYSPKMANAIARALVEEGGRFINDLAQKLAREQVAFAEREVVASGKDMGQSRQKLIAYQNQQGLVSPSGAVGEISAMAARLEGELSDLQARRNALEAYLTPNAPDLVQVREQIRAIEKQLQVQRARLASSGGNTLNRVAEEYDRLALEAGFRQAVYQTSITALEKARMDATRVLKKVSVVQEPTMPEFSMEPGRIYSSAVFVLATLLIAGILHMLLAIVREHRD